MVCRMRFWGAFSIFVLVSVLVCGCGLFEPRTPEAPGTGGTPWIPPTAPETVLVNIENSMYGKVIGNYVQNFTDDLAFHPDPSDSVELSATQPTVYDNWTLDVERTVTQAIFDQAALLDLAFTQRDAPVYVDSDHCVLYYTYLLQVTLKTGGTEYFRGLVEFHMRREGGSNWYVYVWIDKRDPDFLSSRTWGNLKGTKR
ncbi:MAG: hypothetical protein NTX17_08335 [Candidatus Eisenbacteria bacterium]|nr:hypothetical protein [Candidatus Eisenbacteria bacterium]